jgi:outer membrane autotransporter protein
MATRSAVRQKGAVTRIPLIEYHVVPNGKRWDVERDDTFNGSFAYDVHARDAAALEAGLDFGLHDNFTAGLTYGGQFSNRSTDQTVRGTVRVNF